YFSGDLKPGPRNPFKKNLCLKNGGARCPHRAVARRAGDSPPCLAVHGERKRTPPRIGRELGPRTGPLAAEWDRLPACQPRTGKMPVPLSEVHGKPPTVSKSR